MNINQLKEQFKNCNPNTPIYISYMSEEYTLQQPEDSKTCCDYTSTDGGYFYPLFNKKQTMSLSELSQYSDILEINIDVEDGFVFRPMKKALFLNNCIFLIP